ncbi:amidohydrolase [Kribbella solani]|uniref:Putative amidohydrolase YtcJ n=1 Tax=Kribbella solani TaxID=236067 RepID=A0A841DLI3_9ACTN|nr:amidohydrolase family protein [Kribbella solani]MBB5979964.1 putative amidohydrolase YtcJ [Kribbella solani]
MTTTTSALPADLILTNAFVVGAAKDGVSRDLVIRAGRLVSMRPSGSAPLPSAPTVDLDGRFVLPGLWDNHVHFTEWVSSSNRIDLSGARSATEAVALVDAALRQRDGNDRPLVGHGFRDALWPDLPHRDLLDAVAPTTPVCLTSGDLHCAWLNSAALKVLNLESSPTGVLRESASEPATEFAQQQSRADGPSVRAALDAAAARGVVGVIDFEFAPNLDVWARRYGGAHHPIRVECTVWEEHLEDAIARGLRTGDVLPGTAGMVTLGPFKARVDGSLNTRTAYCYHAYPGITEDPRGLLLAEPERLTELMHRATSNGIDCAIHAIGDRANSIALDAFETLGARGTIEHAQLISESDFERFAELGVTASIQPGHTLDDRDAADRLWAGRTGRSFAFGSLAAAGADLLLGSDAPVSPLDPWYAIASAVRRSGDERPSWHPEQELTVAQALKATVRTRRRLGVGDVADIAITELDPFDCTAAELAEMPMYGTLVAGQWTWQAS